MTKLFKFLNRECKPYGFEWHIRFIVGAIIGNIIGNLIVYQIFH